MTDPRHQARDYFRHLLEQPQSSESDWQELFAQHPCILIETLPVRLSIGDIEPLARPGFAEPTLLSFRVAEIL